MYNWTFSLRIARQFRQCYPRASKFIDALYNINIAFSAKLFQSQQKRWELYKRTVIKLSSLLEKADYSIDSAKDLELLKQKLAWIIEKGFPKAPNYLKKA